MTSGASRPGNRIPGQNANLDAKNVRKKGPKRGQKGAKNG